MECMLGSAMYLKSTGMSLEEAERAVGTLRGGPTLTERAGGAPEENGLRKAVCLLLTEGRRNQKHHQDLHYGYSVSTAACFLPVKKTTDLS